MNIYDPSTDTDQGSFYSSLEPFLSATNYNIIGGDFNSISDPQLDKFGGNPELRQSAFKILHTVVEDTTLLTSGVTRTPINMTTHGPERTHATKLLSLYKHR